MAVDFGYIIGPVFLFWIAATFYKKKTGKNISELWKGAKEKLEEVKPEYQRVYINRGVKI